MTALDPKDFEKYEARIIADEMTADQVYYFLLDNKEFARWYLNRLPVRHKGRLVSE